MRGEYGKREEGEGKWQTPSFVAKVAADFHFRGEGDDGDADAVFGAGVERVMDVPGIAGGKGPKEDDYFAGRVGGKVAVGLGEM